jgi:hypothetical protein
MKLDCTCCKDLDQLPKKSLEVEVKVVDEVAAAKVSEKATVEVKQPENDIAVKEVHPKFLDTLDQCPVCKQPLKNGPKPFGKGLHLVQHFQKELCKDLKDKPPYTCPHCPWSKDDLVETMLHVGLDHGEFEKQINLHRRKMMSVKNVVLKVDKEPM